MRRPALLLAAAALLAGGLPALAERGAAPPPPDPQLLDLAQHVDPMVGTLAPGFTVPGAATPFGMTQVSPDTGGEVAYSGYSWHDPQIRGFSHVHLSGPGVKKAGEIPLMPTTGPVLSSDWRQYASVFDHATETATAGYYGVRLDTYGVQAEVSATPRTGIHRYTFPPVPQANVLLDVSRNVPGVQEGTFEAVGDRTVRGEVHGRYPVFFEAEFSRPFTATGTWTGATLAPGSRTAQGVGVGGWVTFDAVADPTVEVKVGISFVDAEGARRNLEAEQSGFAFDDVHDAARAAWNRELAKVQVEGDPLDLRTFYTALYHSLLHPNVFEDVDGRYLGQDGAVHTADRFTQYANFSSWDTYKGQNQLLATVWPDRYRDMLRSLLQVARERGNLPRWAEQNLDAGHMSGDPVVPMVVDGYCRGVLDDLAPELVDELYGEMVELVQRREAAWQEKGYLPLQTTDRGAGTTLEYGVADFALALMADASGRKADAARFAEQSLAYRALLDPGTRWIRPRNDDGSWHEPFDPALDETGFQEGNSWQYSWLAPHDARGLFDGMGGDAAAVERLDQHFLEAATVVPVAPAEAMTRATLFGIAYRTPFYAPGNEHDLQTPWMYPFARQPWKTASVHRQVQGVFRPTVDGLPGNDDLGGLSGWYVWSALGLGPVTPGAPFYVLGSPRFSRALLDLPGSKDVVIEAPGASAVNRYVTAATLGGEPLDRAWLAHGELRKGGTLKLTMGATPTAWATTLDAVPPSLSDSPLSAFACRG